MHTEELKPNITVYGPLFPEPVQVIVAIPMGGSVKLVGKGSRSNSVYEPILTVKQLALLTASPAHEPFNADARKFRLGIEAMRLGLAYEYAPYFSLSIALVDPLPHQLEAVCDYSELPIEKIRTLAKSGVLCFQSRLPDKFWKDLDTAGFDEELTMARILLFRGKSWRT
jgi:hypothetical protein